MRVVITGASGRVGRAVCQVLGESKTETLALLSPRSGSDLMIGDQTTSADMGDFRTLISLFQGCDAVIHCAAIQPNGGGRAAANLYLENIQGVCSVSACAQQAGVQKLVLLSSLGNEDSKTLGKTYHAYLKAKRVGEEVARTLFPGNLIILRPGWVLAADSETHEHVLPSSGVQVIVGSASVPVIWLWDLAKIICRALQFGEGGVHQVVAGQPSQESFFQYVNRLAGGRVRIVDARSSRRLRMLCAVRGSKAGMEFPEWARVAGLPTPRENARLWGFRLKTWQECLDSHFREFNIPEVELGSS